MNDYQMDWDQKDKHQIGWNNEKDKTKNSSQMLKWTQRGLFFIQPILIV